MPNITDVTGLAGVACATAAAVLLLPGIGKLTRLRLALLQGAVFALMLVPFGAMPFAAYLRGMTGDLSVTTLVLLCCAMLRPWCGAVQSRTPACAVEPDHTGRTRTVSDGFGCRCA